MKKNIHWIVLILLITITISACGSDSSDKKGAKDTPSLNSIYITETTQDSISIEQPVMKNLSDSSLIINAYIGINDVITIDGQTVAGAVEGPVNLTGGNGYTFSNLNTATVYKIIVVASYTGGFSIQQIIQSTAGIAPVLNELIITESDDNSITLARPSLSTGGNPLPDVQAYIGIEGTINVSGSSVSAAQSGPIDVANGGCLFSGLNSSTVYRIIVVAKNTSGYSVKYLPNLVLDTIATRVYGQNGSFTSVSGSINGSCLNFPSAAAVDGGGVYIADTLNNRVLYFTGSDIVPSRVYGQGGNLLTNEKNIGGISAVSLSGPTDVAVTSEGVYIADQQNNRVLYYEGISTTASRVYGQDGSFTTNTTNKNGISSNSLYYPRGVYADSTGVYIADTQNNRVLFYEGSSTTASRVYGQGNAFNANTLNNGGVISASSLYFPSAVDVNGEGVYISDSYNHRVLFYEGNSITASRVYGQGDVYNTNNSNKNGVSAGSLNLPRGIAAVTGGLYVADYSNHRVLYYSGQSTTASRVYGQNGDFTSNSGSTVANADTLNAPNNVFVYAGNVYISDTSSHRVLFYEGSSTTSTRVYGQNGIFTSNKANNNGATPDNLWNPSGVSADTGGIYIADCNNNRVLYFEGAGITPSRVYGQNGSFTSSDPNKGGISSGTLLKPSGVTAVTDGVYIADTDNHRVLYFSGTSTIATRVYGQNSSFTSSDPNKGGISSGTLLKPSGVTAVSDGVYIADTNNHRVLYFSGISTTASRVYGQGNAFDSMTVNNGGISASSLNYPAAVAANGEGVFIADSSNQRVLYFSGISTTASRVYGQGNAFDTMTVNKGGISASSLNYPTAIAVNGEGVYIADSYNNRVLYYTGENTAALRVFGQGGSFSSNTSNKTAISPTSLFQPSSVTLDVNNRLLISDKMNNRVLWY